MHLRKWINHCFCFQRWTLECPGKINIFKSCKIHTPTMMSPWRTICLTLGTDCPFIFILKQLKVFKANPEVYKPSTISPVRGISCLSSQPYLALCIFRFINFREIQTCGGTSYHTYIIKKIQLKINKLYSADTWTKNTQNFFPAFLDHPFGDLQSGKRTDSHQLPLRWLDSLWKMPVPLFQWRMLIEDSIKNTEKKLSSNNNVRSYSVDTWIIFKENYDPSKSTK